MLRVWRTRQPAYEVPTPRVHLAKDGQHSQLQSVRRPRRLPEPPRTLKTFRKIFSCETESNNVDKQWLWFEGTLSCYPTKGNRPFISAQLYSIEPQELCTLTYAHSLFMWSTTNYLQCARRRERRRPARSG